MSSEIGLIGSAIGNMDWLPGSGDSVHRRVHPGLGHHPALPLTRVSFWKRAVERSVAPTSSLAKPQCSVTRFTHPNRIRQHSLEHWLEFARRRTNDAKHLRSRRLLLQRLA